MAKIILGSVDPPTGVHRPVRVVAGLPPVGPRAVAEARHVRLSPAEVQTAAMIGVMRQIEALRQGRPDRHGADPDKGWQIHIEGAAGEMALARVVGQYWDMPVNTFKSGGDVGQIQVRTRSRHSHELIIRDDDRDEDVFVLVTGQAPRYRVVGWIRARDGKRDEWRKAHGGREPAWFVPHSALKDVPDRRGDGRG